MQENTETFEKGNRCGSYTTTHMHIFKNILDIRFEHTYFVYILTLRLEVNSLDLVFI